MTVSELEKKYSEIQKESIELHEQLKPFLKRLKSLSKRAGKLCCKADNDPNLYCANKRNGDMKPKDWNDQIIFRLGDFFYAGDAIEGIDNVLRNIIKTKFWRKGYKKMVKVHVSTGPNSSATIAIPEEIVKALPSMDI